MQIKHAILLQTASKCTTLLNATMTSSKHYLCTLAKHDSYIISDTTWITKGTWPTLGNMYPPCLCDNSYSVTQHI